MQEDRKVLLDNQGNPITKEMIEERLNEIYKSTEPLMKRHEWEEDGQLCHSWQINIPATPSTRAVAMWTNDAGAAQIQKAIEKLVKKEYGKETE
jgi:hypothetical protein